LKLVDLDTAATKTVEYSSTATDDLDADNANAADEATDDVTSLRIGSTSVNGPSLSSNY
jgi:hypothetical protein